MKVKIKTWNKMVEEFGIEENQIKCEQLFVDTMEADIPEDRIIEVEEKYDSKLDDEIMTWYTSDCTWVISEDMVEKYL